ncbi:MAG: TRAP transporter large permease subunit, partial [Pseudothermotoga sp.]
MKNLVKMVVIFAIIFILMTLWLKVPFYDTLMSKQAQQIIFLWLSLAFFILIGMPISIAIGLSAVFTTLFLGIPIMAVYQRLIFGINSFAFASIAFFILLGQAVNYTGLSDDLIQLSNLVVGKFKGGFAYVNVLASMLFG